ncbi:insulinase family protein, partial [bacterium]|nr:insulinase family protein [bacterium]
DLAYNVYSFMDTLRNSGIFGVYIGTDPEKMDKVISELEDEYTSIIEKGLTEAEIARVKEQFKGNLMLGLEGTASRMFRAAKMEIYLKKFLTLDEVIELIDAVNLDAVSKVAQDFLNNNKQYTAIILPKEENV